MRDEEAGCRRGACGKAQAARRIERDIFENAEAEGDGAGLQTFLQRAERLSLARRLDEEHPGRIETEARKPVPGERAILAEEALRRAPQKQGSFFHGVRLRQTARGKT